jgi:glucose-like phosphotransferase system IIB component
MKVYKFGGASVRNADGVRNLAHIVEGEDSLFIIVSAMGKTTNALERVFGYMQKGEKEQANEEIKQIQAYHAEIIDELWGEHTDINEVTLLFGQLRNIVNGLGGKANVTSIDNCITRLRLEVKDQTKVDEKKIKSAGVAGVMRPGKTSVQVIVGTKVQFVADEFKKLCK